MQIKTLILASLVGLTTAQDNLPALVAQVPGCAVACLVTGAQAAGCGLTDYKCQCDQGSQIQTAVDPCVQKACKGDDIQKTKDTSNQICKAVGGAAIPGASNSTTSGSTTGSSSTPKKPNGAGALQASLLSLVGVAVISALAL